MQAEAANVPAAAMQQSYAMWFLESLGGGNLFLLVIASLFSLAMTLILLTRGNRWAGFAIVLLVPLPFFVGIYGLLDGFISASIVITRTTTPVNISAADFAAGIATSLLPLYVGLMLCVPTFLLAVFGMLMRSVSKETAVSSP